jgi:ABC-type branched-subunit amino acid transport system substrate-binding protein
VKGTRVAALAVLVAAVVAVAVAPTVSAGREASTTAMRVFKPANLSSFKLPLINVGMSDAIGAPSSSHPGSPAVLVAAARALNRSGGLHGHPLGVVFCNNKTDPNLSSACARQFVDQHVVAVIGGQDINDQLAQPILQAASIPWIAMNPISNIMYSAPNVFIPEVPSLISFEASALYAHFKGYEPIVPISADNTGGRSLLAIIGAVLHQAGGSFAGDPLFVNQAATADYSPFAVAADRFKPGSIFFLLNYGVPVTSVLQALAADGSPYRAAFNSSAYTIAQIRSIGPQGDKLIVPQTFPPFDDPRMAGFFRQLKAEQARGDLNAATDAIGPNDLNGWLGLQVLIKITKGMTDISGPNIINALHSSKTIQVSPFLSWNPQAQGPPNFTNVSNQSVYFIGFKNGQQVLLIKHPVTIADAMKGEF